jgi:hypothetical protein
MSQSPLPIGNENVITGESVFETVFVYGKFNYDFSNDDIAINTLSVQGGSSYTGIVTFGSDVNISADISVVNIVASGSITADSYENFQLADLPVGTAAESTFGPNKVIKVKSDSSGYELVDTAELDSVQLRSTGVSNDGEIYVGTGTTENSKLVISGISTSKFLLNDHVKIFGVTLSSDSTTISDPPSQTIAQIPSSGGSNARTYYYWTAEYHLEKGIIGPAEQAGAAAGIGGTTLNEFNDANHSALTLARSSVNNGLLVYRQEFTGTGNAGNADINSAKLIGILGKKELGDSTTSSISWKDYGNYDQTAWAGKGVSNEYLGTGNTTNQIHFPVIATTTSAKGWAIDKVVAIGASTITLDSNYTLNSNAADNVKVVHDNTYAFSQAIDRTKANGGNTVTLTGGTYLTNKISLPTGFTIRGSGKNTIIKKQYFGTDASDGVNNISVINGAVIGIGTTNGSDITISNLTIDGNNVNSVNFSDDSDNYLVNLDSVSSALIKDVEIRNSAGNGLYLNDTKRVSVENCTFVDGSLSDRYYYRPLSAKSSEVFRLNGSLLENYPGSVDVSSSTVVAATGNIIRNCGRGLESYATGKITTINNIMLGPADEWLPSPDIYDSDWDGVNVTVTRNQTFDGPVLQFLEDGEPKDLRSTQLDRISAGIGTLVGLAGTNATDVSLGSTFLSLNLLTPEDNEEFSRENGYIQMGLTQAQTNTLGVSSILGYEITAQEYQTVPTGLSTSAGISTGVFNTIGSGCTNYLVTLNESSHWDAFAEGDIVKLVNHESTPDLSADEFEVGIKSESAGGSIKKLELRFRPNPGTTQKNTSSGANGEETGYISKRKSFIIAKGRVGVN